jgi:hypothetical protein
MPNCKPNVVVTQNRLLRHADVQEATVHAPTEGECDEWTIEVVLEASADAVATSLLDEIVRRNAALADVSPQGDQIVVTLVA